MPERIIPTDDEWWPEYGWEHLQRYAFASRYCRAGVGLDFGCGIGYGTEILARAGATAVAGLDADAAVIREAERRGHPANARFYSGLAAAAAAHPGGFDFAVMFEVIEHVATPVAVLGELAACLKPGALLVVSAPNKLRFTGAPEPVANEFHVSEPTHAELRQWLSHQFDVVEEFEQSDLRLGALDQVAATLQQSWLLRFERGLRRMLGRPLHFPAHPDQLIRNTDIFPLILERRAVCRQFVFVARRR